MAKGFDKGRSARRGVGDEYRDPQAELARKLGEIVSDLYLSTEENDIKRLWSSAHRLVLKSSADPARIETIMKQRRIGALSTLAQELATGSARGPLGRQASPAVKPTITGIASSAAPVPVADESKTADAAHVESPAAASSSGPSSEMLKSAMKAFRKRLKLTKLDDESRLGSRAMTGGRQSKVVAIMPPREYPRHVWEELARQGKLRDSGSGFYELVGE
jgi:hypothetical protein